MIGNCWQVYPGLLELGLIAIESNATRMVVVFSDRTRASNREVWFTTPAFATAVREKQPLRTSAPELTLQAPGPRVSDLAVAYIDRAMVTSFDWIEYDTPPPLVFDMHFYQGQLIPYDAQGNAGEPQNVTLAISLVETRVERIAWYIEGFSIFSTGSSLPTAFGGNANGVLELFPANEPPASGFMYSGGVPIQSAAMI